MPRLWTANKNYTDSLNANTRYLVAASNGGCNYQTIPEGSTKRVLHGAANGACYYGNANVPIPNPDVSSWINDVTFIRSLNGDQDAYRLYHVSSYSKNVIHLSQSSWSGSGWGGNGSIRFDNSASLDAMYAELSKVGSVKWNSITANVTNCTSRSSRVYLYLDRQIITPGGTDDNVTLILYY